MADAQRPAKAQLLELNSDYTTKENGKKVSVQFNPETLKVSYANQIAQPQAATPAGSGPSTGGAQSTGDQSQQAGRQFVGAGTTKLALQLWFDVNGPLPADKEGTIDVRELTKEVAYFITPLSTDDNPPQFIPPALRFLWGSFHFDGLIDSLEESIEFFSDDGLPLRASMTLNMSQQKIEAFEGRRGGANGAPPGTGPAPGTRPLAQAPAGASLQGLADSQGKGGDWQAIAAANGIENPRLLAPGQLIDLNVGVRVR